MSRTTRKLMRLAVCLQVGACALPAQAQDMTSYSIEFGYDDEQRLTEFTLIDAWFIQYDYDDSGNVLGTQMGPLEPQSGDDLPTQFALHAGYPNPFGAQTVLRFDLPEAERVHLAIYDLLGRLVAVLASGEHAAGRHSVSWQALGMGSGAYLAELRAGHERKIRPIVLLR